MLKGTIPRHREIHSRVGHYAFECVPADILLTDIPIVGLGGIDIMTVLKIPPKLQKIEACLASDSALSWVSVPLSKTLPLKYGCRTLMYTLSVSFWSRGWSCRGSKPRQIRWAPIGGRGPSSPERGWGQLGHIFLGIRHYICTIVVDCGRW